jgi:methylphosphotriester-DNA--protein-cysteine methyltransferase
VISSHNRPVLNEQSNVIHEPAKTYRLIGADGKAYDSLMKGTLGGHKGSKIYGRLECWGAKRHLANGTYQKSRVFFVDAATAIAAGYRACKQCKPDDN